ncbi:MAG: permease-like cell division protein FtsX [Clostridia bacterium]|nr:permease-like cell division protein FtsX [Clostridia bacterium]
MKKGRASVFSQLGYYIKEGVGGIFVHGFMSFAAITVIAACLLVTATFMLLAHNIDVQIEELQDSNEIVVYIDSGFTREQAQALQSDIMALDNIENAIFVTKEELFENFLAGLGEDTHVLEELRNDNPVRDSFRVIMKDISLHSETLKALMEVAGIADSNSDVELSEKLVSLRSVINTISITLIIMLGAVSLFIISNTVKLALHARADEIGIMKMVGATNGFIRGPFVVEGIVLGVVAAVFVFAAQWAVYNYLGAQLLEGFGAIFELVPFETFRYELAAMLFGAGVVLGVGGSVITIRRFMRV